MFRREDMLVSVDNVVQDSKCEGCSLREGLISAALSMFCFPVEAIGDAMFIVSCIGAVGAFCCFCRRLDGNNAQALLVYRDTANVGGTPTVSAVSGIVFSFWTEIPSALSHKLSVACSWFVDPMCCADVQPQNNNFLSQLVQEHKPISGSRDRCLDRSDDMCLAVYVLLIINLSLQYTILSSACTMAQSNGAACNKRYMQHSTAHKNAVHCITASRAAPDK